MKKINKLLLFISIIVALVTIFFSSGYYSNRRQYYSDESPGLINIDYYKSEKILPETELWYPTPLNIDIDGCFDLEKDVGLILTQTIHYNSCSILEKGVISIIATIPLLIIETALLSAILYFSINRLLKRFKK